MNEKEIIAMRLQNQKLLETDLKNPSDVVKWFCAMQSQDYASAKWAVGMRVEKASSNAIEILFNKGKILRTHLLRPTWHFVSQNDIRWLTELTAPRIRIVNSFMNRKLELDENVFKKSNKILLKALQGRNLMRDEIRNEFSNHKIRIDENRMAHLLMHAELDGIICSGPRIGKQFSYKLLDEVVAVSKFDKEKSLKELTTRYYKSRGPATVYDFASWSGLTLNDVRTGIESVTSLQKFKIGKSEYMHFDVPTNIKMKSSHVLLLPNYDEYYMGYRDRSLMMPSDFAEKMNDPRGAIFNHAIVLNGKLIGMWRRTIGNKNISIEINNFFPVTNTVRKNIQNEFERLGTFEGKPFEISGSGTY